jgi:hypothetical protein
MKPAEHLRPEIAFGYRNQLLTVDELRAADAHLATCESCREQLAMEMDAAGMAAFLRESLREESIPPASRVPNRRSLAWIGATLAAAAVAVWFFIPRSAPELFPGVRDRTSAAVTAGQKQAAEIAMRSGQLPLPPSLDELAPRHEVLMGGTAPARESVEPLTPVATVVLSKRPTFHWKPLAGEWTYIVRVFRPGFELVAESPAVSGSEWTTPQDLSPGIVYEWQVEASRGAERAVYPQPPQTPPRFRIADDRDAKEMGRLVGQNLPHLVLGIEYARLGLMENARAELSLLVGDNPQSAELRRLLDSLKKNR